MNRVRKEIDKMEKKKGKMPKAGKGKSFDMSVKAGRSVAGKSKGGKKALEQPGEMD